MNARKILLSLAIIGTLTLCFADVTTPSPIEIDVQIKAIQNANPEDRVELMNQFKIELSNMNAEDRSEAIAQMQTKMQDHESDINHPRNDMNRNNMQEHTDTMQSNANEGMHRMQNMNQQQAGNHYGQDIQSQDIQSMEQDYMQRDY